MNHEKDFLRRAAAAGYTFEVGSEGEVDYRGPDAKRAWEVVIYLEEADVRFIADGKVQGWALISAYGLEDDETIMDCSGPIYLIAKAIGEKNP